MVQQWLHAMVFVRATNKLIASAFIGAIMRDFSATVLIGIIGAVGFAFLLVALPSASPILTFAAVEQAIAEETNAYRQRRKLKPLVLENRLQQTARVYAHTMATTRQFGHEVDGRTPAQRVRLAGYKHCIVRENIGYLELPGDRSAKEIAGRVLSGWIASDGHRKNLEASNVTGIGIGVAGSEGGDEPKAARRYYAVQLLAKPLAEAFRFSVRNTRAQTIKYTVDGKQFALPPNTLHKHLRCTQPLIEARVLGEKRLYKPGTGETIDL